MSPDAGYLPSSEEDRLAAIGCELFAERLVNDGETADDYAHLTDEQRRDVYIDMAMDAERGAA